MIKKITGLIFVFLFLQSVNANFKKISKDDQSVLHKKLLEVTRKVKTIKSNFTQIKYLSALSDKVISKGLFYYKNPANIRWQYKTPFKYTIIFKNGKIFINDEGKVNKYDMTSNDKYKEINDLMINCLQGTIIENNEKFIISYFQDRKFILVKLTPFKKGMQGLIKEINIYFERRKYSVEKLKIVEKSGDFTEIVFQRKKFNLSFTDNVFNINK